MNLDYYKLADICTFTKGSYSTLSTEPGNYTLVVTAEYRRTANTYQMEGPAVCIPLISSTGHGDAALHRVHYQEGKFALANLLVALTPKYPELYDTKYLYHLLMAKKDEYFVPLMLGTANVSLKIRDIAAVEIPLPPLNEQRRIVAHVEALTAPIAEASSLRQSAVEEVEALLSAREFEIWNEATLNGAPTLGDVTEYLARGRHSQQGESLHRLIKTQHVQLGYYIRSKITLDPELTDRVHPEAIVRRQDVLIACSAAGCLGRVARYDSDEIASTDTHVAIARANPEIILPEYLYAYLHGSQGQLQLRSRERGDWQREKVGFRLTELNLADLKRVPVPLPSFDEQRHIVAYLDELQVQVDTLKHLQSETTAELDALLPSVLDKAFRGEL